MRLFLQFIVILLYKFIEFFSRKSLKFKKKAHFACNRLYIILRVSSEEGFICRQVVVHMIPYFERTQIGTHTPQFIVIHTIFPLSFSLFINPNLLLSNCAYRCIHCEQIVRIDTGSLEGSDIAFIEHCTDFNRLLIEQIKIQIEPVLEELGLLDSHYGTVL